MSKIKKILEFIENLLRLIIGTILGVAVMAMVMPIYIIGQILEKIKKRDKKWMIIPLKLTNLLTNW